MQTVLLSGCGNIGFRHLEAIVQLAAPLRLIVVEPNPAAHPRIQTLLDAHRQHQGAVLTALPQTLPHLDLVVSATSADTRRAAVDAILGRASVGAMILEKVLFQTLSDLDAVGAMLAAKNIPAFVNCGRRYAPGYLDLRQALTGPVDVTVRGSAWGLTSNGVHFLDLAEFLNGSGVAGLDGSALTPGWVDAKRAGCVEVFGTFTGTLTNGATISVECRDEPTLAFTVDLTTPARHLTIDEIARQATEDGQTSPFAFKRVSELVEIYADALSTRTCGLTPYADSARQHRHFLAMVLQHMGRQPSEICPIS